MSKHKNKRSGKGISNQKGAVHRGGNGNAHSLSLSSAHVRSGNGAADTVPHSIPEATLRVNTSARDLTIAEASTPISAVSAEPALPDLIADLPPGTLNYREDEHSGGQEIIRARVALPSPVKVRVGQPLDNRPFTGSGAHETNGHQGNGTDNGHYGNGHNGHTTGSLRRARFSLGRDSVVVAPGTLYPTTGHLPQSDLLRARARLGNSNGSAVTMPLAIPHPYPRHATDKIHSRSLPYFLMRQRNMRSSSRVGHTRARAASRRFGNKSPMRPILLVFLVFSMLFGLVMAGGMGAGIGGAALYLNGLPPIDQSDLAAAIAKNGINVQTSTFYDRKGRPIYEVVDEQTGRREEIPLKSISPLVINATLAAEDADFHTNPGVDIRGIVRAVNINLSGQGSSGASTITQQLVRLLLMDEEERSKSAGWEGFNRKAKEAILAVQLTRKYSKDFILETYLNQIPYGNRAFGIQAAARTYFDKKASELTLEEAAMLAGLPQAPSYYDPFLNFPVAQARQHIVLDLMAKNGMVTQAQADDAKTTKLNLVKPKQILEAPHFVYYVKDYLERTRGEAFLDQGLKIYTTLDLDVQATAQKIASDRVDEIRKQRASNAAIVIMKPRSGEILAMVGSVDYNDESIDGQVNVAVAERQPGSSFKPITFATAFEKGWVPGTTILDVLTQFPGGSGQKPYVPKNYDGRDHGWVTVREALANSYNIPAVKALQFAGIQETLDTAHNMGIKGLKRGLDYYGLSLTLGGGEVTLLDMTTAYSTFANGGLTVGANPIYKIVDAQGRQIVSPNDEPDGTQALDPRTAYMITSILSDNRARTPAFGSNSALRTSFPSAAKTGTTDNNRDSWTLGYTPSLAVGVWVGNSDNSEMNRITGAIGAAVIWNKVMEEFYDNEEFVDQLLRIRADKSVVKLQTEFVQPDGLIRASACSAKGNVTDLFLKEAKPKNCLTYKDPKGNVLLHAAPSDKKPPQTQPKATPKPQPTAKPTPIPGIWPPGWVERLPDQQQP